MSSGGDGIYHIHQQSKMVQLLVILASTFSTNPKKLCKNVLILIGLKRALPKKSQYLKVPLKEVLSATNNLNQMNFIGEGTAGDHK